MGGMPRKSKIPPMNNRMYEEESKEESKENITVAIQPSSNKPPTSFKRNP